MLLTEFDRFFEPFWGMPRYRQRGVRRRIDFPPFNVWLSDEKAVITTELPGLNPEDIELSVIGKVVTLKGTRKADDFKNGESYHRRERWHGSFTKSIELPFNIENQKVTANFAKGILKITLPRAEAEKPKKIEIRSE
jgi:HSP20 family protein